MTTPASALDLRHVLPRDWIDQVLGWRPSSSALASYIKRLQEVVDHHRSASIMLQRVQELALSVCGEIPIPPLPGHVEVFERLESRSGSAALAAPFAERKVKKSIYGIAEDLESAEAEWLVLGELLRRGWTDIPFERKEGSPDWRVRKRAGAIDVDVKQKASRSSAWMKLTWALRGAALDADAEFLNDYSWEWDVPESCRADVAARFIQAFWDALPKLKAFLADQADHEEVLWSDQRHSLTATRETEAVDLIFIRAAEADRAEETLSVSCVPTRHPRYISLGTTDARFVQEFDLNARDTLVKSIEKLGIQKQASARANSTLFIVVWHVPFNWEPLIDRAQLTRTVQEISVDRGWPALILWPLGSFELANSAWSENADARGLLGNAKLP